ncbi:glycoside hydrolase family 2 protein [Actinopolymorpha singaporensis]|uniref:beta-mannosidase n=1 Tax=Actinopolymorpha singaporensis TaxID=117157 RepID=A0A1H1VRT4_9ACTN|nr:glycoside hydrolase family 2 protein [Actinopolymorpha singaporensis]SDS87472.1 beta-mannosidase [Actinopolymorpha singaporensis]
MSQWRELHEGWTLQVVGEADGVPREVADAVVPATVPGCVHTDLLAADLIPDPYLDRNEYDLAWIGRACWRYATSFDWTPDGSDRVDLVCDGLDTVATVELNGEVVATTQNMHRSYRFDVGGRLREGRNELVVTFASAQAYAERLRDELGDLPGPNSATPEPFNFIRKMACNFGWDWGPVLVTAGIWKSIGLHSWSGARLARVRPVVDVDLGEQRDVATAGRVRVLADVEYAGPALAGSDGDSGAAGGGVKAGLTLTASVAGSRAEVEVPAGATSAEVELSVDNPRLWWPHGHGEQPLYDLAVELSGGSEGTLDGWSRRVGFRQVQLDTEPDDAADPEAGSAFTLVVNGVPVFARGANWIPDDCFPSRVDAARYRARLQQAKDAHIDLLRVWGGGLYEQDTFYDAADELGILVWQDFLFACAAYPEESPIAEEVEAEARENVARLMPHPSLVLWNGNNENIWAWFDWGWQPKVGDRTWGAGYYLDLLPRVVGETDPSRPYWPGSPYSGSMDRHPNTDEHGCKHVWDVWNQVDYSVYRTYVPRFVAEFGWQGPPTWATLTRAVHDDPLAADSPGVLSHQKATDGNAKLARGLTPHFPEPADVEDWHWSTQLNQARALTVGIEHYRSHRGRCMGTVVWQINDCWPVTSWAAVDGDARPKPLWYALRKVYDPRLVTVQPRPEGLTVFLVNEGLTGGDNGARAGGVWRTDLAVERRTFTGEVLAHWSTSVSVDPAATASVRVPVDVATTTDPSREYVLVVAGDRRTTWFFAADKDLAYPAPEWDVEVTADGPATRVTVTARTLVRDLALFADRLDPAAGVDDMLVTLLPGESHTFRISGLTRPVDVAEVSGRPVLRCANDTVSPAK